MEQGKTITTVNGGDVKSIQKRLERKNTKERLSLKFAQIIELAHRGELSENKTLWKIINETL